MADLNLNELRAAAQHGVTAHKFWVHALDILNAIPIAQQLVTEATNQRTQLAADIVALQDKVRAAADEAKTRLSQIDAELAEKVEGVKAKAALVIADLQAQTADWQNRVTIEAAKSDAVVKNNQQIVVAAQEQAEFIMRQAQENAETITAQSLAVRESAEAELTDFRNKAAAEKRSKKAQLDDLNNEIQAAQGRLNSLQTELKLARTKFATALGDG